MASPQKGKSVAGSRNSRKARMVVAGRVRSWTEIELDRNETGTGS